MKTWLRGSLVSAAAVAMTMGFVQTGHATAFSDLSAESQLIVDRVKTDTDANTACKSKDTLKAAVTTAVEELLKSGKLTGKPHDQAFDAGKYMYLNCGSI